MEKNQADYTACPLQALPGTIVVTPYKEESSYLSIADSVKDRDLAGVVLSIGEAIPSEYDSAVLISPPKGLKLGDIVIHSTYYSAPYRISNEYYKFVKFQECRAIFKEQK